MKQATSISAMQKFYFGSKVFCSDGEDGYLAQVLFDPATLRMTYIGLKHGRVFGKVTYLPFASVTGATGDGITLHVTRVEAMAGTGEAISGAILDNKSSVKLSNSAAKGTLLLVAVHPGSGELAYIVGHHVQPGQDTHLQQEYVTGLASGQVTVSIPAQMLKTLPPYRPDRVLQQDVEAIVFDFTPIHIDLKGMTLRVLDGVLYMDGNISSSLRGDIVRDQVMGVPGLLEIKNCLVGDDTLAGNLAMALGNDPRTRDLPIGVYPRLGVVRLSGAVHNGQQKAAAEEIARNFPGVRSVINDLIVDPKADMLYVMSSSEGGEAEDKVPGKYIRHTK